MSDLVTVEQYEEMVIKTAIPLDKWKDQRLKGALGVCSEAGEIAGLLEKHYYQGHELDCEELKKELGDAMWYLTYLIRTCGYSVRYIMSLNAEKLAKRYPEGHFDALDSIRRIDQHDR